MALFYVVLEGADDILDIFNSVGEGQFMRGVGAAVFAEANTIMNQSMRQVPLEDGILRGSATVEKPEISGQTFSIAMGYGGNASAYALIQHENLGFHHPGMHSKRKGQTGRKAKYLEDPVKDAAPNLEAKLARMVMNLFDAKTFGI
jgi:hypothetical protein